ncbi:response regulator transcription factor [Arthrobacter agilis]|uniref:response regulator transcription factor n=1 Tax=Arthrobacter agilis TaxID=37921 RepID=UPI000B36026A|nr:response regulator transcription factor [Arthrobacter agilis]OUM41536.1 DNA-binding response regulator [Arthrobacter agilis]PPB47297.1 DNA-binding response regulator [Arthrobacter agilis]TPV26888.1 response regulator transcription factor [Arthrobacter agilis]VDR32989.1 Transcriptional regulatory protein YycF [Arthrobacter agilis]
MSDPGVAVVIEDDADVRNLVGAVLRQSGFEVHVAPDGKTGVDLVRSQAATVVTLDVGLPDIDGYEVLRRIRAFSTCYVVMLTSRGDELDTLTALQSGADDYLTKPFRPRELRARIAAMLRRPRSDSEEDASPSVAPARPAIVSVPTPEAASVLEHNGLLVNASARTVVVDGRDLLLTRSEFDLLHEMLKSRGAVRTKADLVRVVRGDYYDEDTYISDSDERAIEVHVGNLRRKLEEDPRNPRWMQTVRGVGYRLTPVRAAASD